MARSKAKPDTEGAAPAQDGAAKISKKECVRRALAHFGADAGPQRMKPFIQSTFGIEMSSNHISSYKSSILKETGNRPAKKGKAPPRSSTKPAGHNEVQTDGISLKDLWTIKELAGRLGPARLRELIDVLCL